MRLHLITQTHSRPSKKRVGRGISAGQGKTAGRGTKGQKARTGANSNIPRTFVGAATSMIQRLPKLKGFTSHRIKPVAVNMARLTSIYDDGATISLVNLLENGLINTKDLKKGVKIVGSSAVQTKKFTFDQTDTRLTVSSRLQNV